MPKSQVREAIATYLDPYTSNITYLSKVYQALPKIANEQDLFNLQPQGQGFGAIIYLFIEGQQEHRASLGGASPPSGFKLRAYTVALLCIFKSDLAVALAGQVAFDQFIDSLTAYIQASRDANDPTTIFQWGEGDTLGAPDLRFDFPVPKTVGGNSGVILFQAVGRVTALEFLQT